MVKNVSERELPLRIGLFSESFHPVQNGVTTSVLTQVSELRGMGHHVSVFAPENQQQREKETHVVRFPSFVTQFNPEYPLVYPFLPRFKLTQHIGKLKLDIVHTHTPFILGLTGADLAIRHNIPLISTFHTLYSQYSHYVSFLPETFTQSLLEAYLPWYYNRCSTIICPSQVAADHLRSLNVERPIVIVPTGVPLPAPEETDGAARQRVRKRLGIDAQTPLMLFAGRLAPEKNTAWLLEVFAVIRKRLPTAKLAIAGGGPLAETLQALAKALNVGDSTLFLGPTPHSEMAALYAAADVFCFPSPSETQGLVIGEAHAAGTPAVVINSGGAAEAIEDGVDGYLIPLDDREQFAGCVVRIVQDAELRARLSANALRNAQECTPEKMTRRVLDIYRQVIAQSSEEKRGKRRTHRDGTVNHIAKGPFTKR